MPETTILNSPENIPAPATETPAIEGTIARDGACYAPYTAEFLNDISEMVRYTFHFRRPQRLHVLRIAKASKDKGYDVQKEVLVELALAEERQPMREAFDEYPLLAVTFGDEVFRKAGAGSVFLGK